MKTPAKRFGRRQEFVDTINERSADSENLVYGINKDEYTTICFHCENGEKRLYRFYHILDAWYMEDEDGNVHADADFLSDYNIYVEPIDVKAKVEFSQDVGEKKLKDAFDTYDLNYFFAKKVIDREANRVDRSEAISAVRTELKMAMIRLNYAKKMGHDPSAEEIERGKQKKRDILANAEVKNMDETEFNRDLEKGEDAFAARWALQDLYQSLWDEFREGKDIINGVQCEKFENYWNEFLFKAVYADIDDKEMQEIEQRLDEAEQFVIDYLSKE